jgi:hypothetical protein
VLLSEVMLSSHPQVPARDRPTPRETATSSISGRVVAVDSNEPLRNARVALGGAPTAVAPVFTDNDGRFAFTGLPAGHYTVSARKAGYAPTTFGQRRPESLPLPIELDAGGVFQRCELRMPRSAGISGRIVDEFGDPMELAIVQALRLSDRVPFPTAVSAATATTDDLGDYRLGGLPAGTYIVSAATPTPGPTHKHAYYPGVPSAVQAQRVTLQAGDERSATDFALVEGRLGKLTLSFVDPRGEPVNAVAMMFNMGMTERIPNLAPFVGTVVKPMLGPGDYSIFARTPEGLVGTARVTMGSDDFSMVMTLTKGGRIAGRVVGEDGPFPRDAALYVEGLPDVLSMGGLLAPGNLSWSARVTDQGAFELNELLGPRRLTIRPAGPGPAWFVTAIVHDGRNLLDQTLDFKGGEVMSGVQVVVSNRGGTITGTAASSDRAPATDYFVILFPEEASSPARLRRLMRVMRSNQNGRFTIDHAAPGKYLAVAVQDIDGVATMFPLPQDVDRFRTHAASVSVADGQTTRLALILDQ